MSRNLRDRWFALPQENNGDLNPVKVEIVAKLRLRRSNGWVVLEFALENHSDITVQGEDASISLNNLETGKRTPC